MKDLIQEDRYLRAKKRVKQIKGFYSHLSVYVIINFILIVLRINSEGWHGFNWELFSTAIFWGIGLFFHWYGVFGKNLFFSKEWEKRKLQEIMDKDKTS